MCVNCGCHEINNDHGEKENIILDDLIEAGDTNDQTLQETVDNMQRELRNLKSSFFDKD